MPGLRLAMFRATIPVTIVLVAWIVIGRMVFGVLGWWALIMMPVGGVALVGLIITTVLAFLQRVPVDEGRLTPLQGRALAGLWISLLAFGFFLVDYGDTPESEASALTQVIGETDATIMASYWLFALSALAAIVCYAWLLALLVVEWRQRRRQDAEPDLTPR